VVTGWGNDEIGEFGLGGFYTAQLAGPPFFGYLTAIAMLSTVLRRRSLQAFMDALVTGYGMGEQSEPLFGTDWSTLWNVPLDELRARFGIRGSDALGEGIRAAV
jgi:ubiquinone biosynthesis protein COQ4